MAVRVTGSITKISLDGKKFTKTFDDKANILMRNAAREWLRAVIVKIPVYSGFAKGSVKFAKGAGGQGNLSAFLGVAIPITPTSKYKPKYYNHHGTKVLKQPDRAGRFANFNFSSPNHFYQFTYSNKVLYFDLNDFYGSEISGEAWKSIEAGNKAFRHYINSNIRTKLPSVNSAIVKTPVRFY